MTTNIETAAAANTLRSFINNSQRNVIIEACYHSEEADFFKDKLVELAELVITMPKTYEQDGKGDSAVVYLHYFRGDMDWYITEKDMEDEQLQAFGLADLGMGFPELGYISIQELVENNIELDLHWTPKTLAEVKA